MSTEDAVFVGTSGKEKQSLNIAGWSIPRDNRGFHRAFRNIRGKVRGVYLGRDLSDTEHIKNKLTKRNQDITGKADTDSKPDTRSDLSEFKTAYERIGQGRGFVRIHRIRESLKWSPKKFDKVLAGLMVDYSVDLPG